jgi:hypothetical protein
MALSIAGHAGGGSRRVTYLSARSSKPKRLNDPWACKMEGRVADLKRRIPILKRLIVDCDRLAGDLDEEVGNEEDRVKIHDPADVAYSTYAKATASRRDNLRRSADELRAHLAKAEGALRELFELFQLSKSCSGNSAQSGNDGADGYYGGTEKDQEDEVRIVQCPKHC